MKCSLESTCFLTCAFQFCCMCEFSNTSFFRLLLFKEKQFVNEANQALRLLNWRTYVLFDCKTFISEIEEVINACVLAREQKLDVSVRRPLVIVIVEERFKARVLKLLRSAVVTRRYTLWIGNVDCIVS